MKHKKNYITRMYTFVHLLEHYILNNDLVYSSDDTPDFFLQIIDEKKDDFDINMHKNLIDSYIKNKTLINETRQMFQTRLEETVDLAYKAIINLAIAEYLHYNLDKKLIINVYVNITYIFEYNTSFVHSILDKSIDYLQNKNKIEENKI